MWQSTWWWTSDSFWRGAEISRPLRRLKWFELSHCPFLYLETVIIRLVNRQSSRVTLGRLVFSTRVLRLPTSLSLGIQRGSVLQGEGRAYLWPIWYDYPMVAEVSIGMVWSFTVIMYSLKASELPLISLQIAFQETNPFDLSNGFTLLCQSLAILLPAMVAPFHVIKNNVLNHL